MCPENAPQFAVYNLRKSFSKEPNGINDCPVCGDLLLKFNIPPSKAVVDQILHHSDFHYDYSHLYKCPSCTWWAIRESWLEIEWGWYDFLIEGEAADLKDAAWQQVLENRDVYFEAKTCPKTIRQLFAQKDIHDYFVPGDKVRLRVDVVVRQPVGIAPPVCLRGSKGDIAREGEYLARYTQQLKDWCASENILLDDIVKRAMLQEVKAKLESGRCCAVRLQSPAPMPTERSEKFGVCKTGEIYLIETADLERREQR